MFSKTTVVIIIIIQETADLEELEDEEEDGLTSTFISCQTRQIKGAKEGFSLLGTDILYYSGGRGD